MSSLKHKTHLVVALGYNDVYGKKPTWNDFSECIRAYSLEKIVELASRVILELAGSRHPGDQRSLVRIANGLFGAEAKRFNTAIANLTSGSLAVPFHERQVLNLTKAAMLIQDPKRTTRADSPLNFGKALLMITDLTEANACGLERVPEDAPEFSRKWMAYLLANELTTYHRLNMSFARYYHLYLSEHPDLRECGSYVNLPQRFRDLYELDTEEYWSTTFALLSYWGTRIDPEGGFSAPLAVNSDHYFRKNLNLPAERSDRYIALQSQSADQLCKAVRKRYSLEEIRPFDFLPFARRPLVSFGSRLYVSSMRLLSNKLTTGLHHLLLDQRIPRDERQLFLTFMGEVFQQYCDLVLKRIFPHGALLRRYVSLDDFRQELGKGKYCDGIVAYNRSIVLLEFKAKLLPFPARSGEDPDATSAKVVDIYQGAGDQILRTLKRVDAGFQANGVIPECIDQVFPVILTLDDIPMNPPLYAEIDRLMPAEFHSDRRIMPVQSISISELERLEPIIASGHSLLSVLQGKTSDEAMRASSFGNFMYNNKDLYEEPANEALRDLAEDVMTGAREFFEKYWKD